MIRVYRRCNGGHYFQGPDCPLDGWAESESMELDTAARRLAAAGIPPSIAALRDVGVSKEALDRAIVVEFGNRESAFELMSPEGYVAEGEWIPRGKFDDRFR